MTKYLLDYKILQNVESYKTTAQAVAVIAQGKYGELWRHRHQLMSRRLVWWNEQLTYRDSLPGFKGVLPHLNITIEVLRAVRSVWTKVELYFKILLIQSTLGLYYLQKTIPRS